MKWHNGTQEYYEFKVAGFTLSYLPKKVGYFVACLTADIVYVLSPAKRAAVKDNMKHVLGSDVDEAILKKTVRSVLRNTGKNYFDLIKMPRMKIEEIERSILVHGWQDFEAALGRGRGVIFVTAHLGSFDVAAQILVARSIKATVLVEPLESAPLLSHLISLRESKGLSFVPVQLGMLKTVVQSLHRGEVVVLACDRDISKDGFRSKFFGEETTMPVGAVRIAMRTGAALVPVFNLRRTDGRYDIYIEPAIELVSGGDEAMAGNMEQVIAVMEKYIRMAPEQWVTLSPIWADGHQGRLEQSAHQSENV